MGTEVAIDHRSLHGANADLDRVVRAVETNIRTLRAEFTRLGVPSHNIDAVLGAEDDLDTRVVPALRRREREAEELARLPYSGALLDQLAGRDLSVDEQPISPVETSISALTGGTTSTPPPTEFVPEQAPEPPQEEPPLLSVGGIKKLGGDLLGGIQDGAEWLAGKVSEAWDTLAEEVSKAWEAMASWWDDMTADLGAWIDENLAGVREWIKNNVIILRIIAIVLKVVGWILVVVGAVLLILAIIASATGIGALAGVPGAGVALIIMGIGGSLIGAGDMVDTVADWGEGKIDGQELVQQLAIEGAFTLVSLLIPGGVFLKLGKKLLDALPASMRRKIVDFLARLFKRDQPPTPTPRGPGPDDLPGKNRPLVGGTPDNPRQYEYDSPGESLRNTEEPSFSDLDDIDMDATYPVGSHEYLLQRWQAYLNRMRQEGRTPWSWERWRDTAINNWARQNKGEAYEQAFWDDHGFRVEDGWSRNTDVELPDGRTRNYDYVDEANGIAYEFKSGGNPSLAQIEKDAAMIRDRDWTIIYILSDEPSAAAQRAMREAGIEWEVWAGVGSPTG